MNAKYRVDVYEYERGWGSRLDFQRDFDDKALAQEYMAEFNSKNTDSVAPDWYMVAQKPRLVDLDVDGPPKD